MLEVNELQYKLRPWSCPEMHLWIPSHFLLILPTITVSNLHSFPKSMTVFNTSITPPCQLTSTTTLQGKIHSPYYSLHSCPFGLLSILPLENSLLRCYFLIMVNFDHSLENCKLPIFYSQTPFFNSVFLHCTHHFIT